VLQKEFVGGSISMASARSASGLRSQSKRVLVIDEVDGPPRLLTTGEGTWLDVVYARSDAWGARKKIMEFSTPSTFEDSLIRECYEAGDRRVFKVPCPRCGVVDVLEFENMRSEMRGGQLYQVWYECPHCNGIIQNYEKAWMMTHAEWVPTAIATSRGHRSYHISSMYSPVGMLSWFELYQKYLEAKDKPGGMRSWTNLYLGLPYKEKGSRPKLEKVIELRGEYREGEVPDGVLYTTMGLDVQQGSATDSENPPRLELEIVGWGAGYRSWSLLYRVFPGAIDNIDSGAWADLHQWAVDGGLSLKRADGVAFPTSLILMDCGDGTNYDIVFGFTARWSQCYPSKGFSSLLKKKNEKGDEAGPGNFVRYRRTKTEKSGETELYTISTNFYKGHLYSNLKIERQDFEPQKPRFCAFPRDRGERFFKQLVSEERHTDGSFHAGGRRNEALDCRVMAHCAADIFLDAKVMALRVAAKAQGANDMELMKINHDLVFDMMTKQIAMRRA
jgi:phage terminase large subunit GpA-like protein